MIDVSCGFNNFPANCDWVRERFGFDVNISIYEVVEALVQEVKRLDIPKPVVNDEYKEKKNVGRPKKRVN